MEDKKRFEELKKDSEELQKFISTAERIRVKNVLTVAKTEIDNEIVSLEIKARRLLENPPTEKPSEKRYLTELTEYAWDQSDKFVKLYVTLDGVQNVDESNVVARFTENSVNLWVSDLRGKDFTLTINNLVEAIDAKSSYRKIKSGLVAIYMKKQTEAQHWDHLTTIARRLKEKQDKELKSDSDGPEDALINIMKKMYKSGDSKTKQMIAKAWSESQEKIRTGNEGSDF